MADLSRLILKEVECTPQENGEWRLKVSVALQDRIFVGEAISANEEYQFEGVALATVEAINRLLPPQIKVSLADTGRLHSAKIDKTLFVVIVQFIESSKIVYMSGS